MRVIRWLLLLTSVIIYHVWFPIGNPPPMVRLDYEIVAIALVGLARGPRVGAAAGWGIGFLVHAADPDHMVWGALLGSLLGWLIGVWRERLFLERLTSQWLVFTLGILGYKIFYMILVEGGSPADWLLGLPLRILPTTLINSTLGVLIGVLWERSRTAGPSALEKVLADDSKRV